MVSEVIGRIDVFVLRKERISFGENIFAGIVLGCTQYSESGANSGIVIDRIRGANERASYWPC